MHTTAMIRISIQYITISLRLGFLFYLTSFNGSDLINNAQENLMPKLYIILLIIFFHNSSFENRLTKIYKLRCSIVKEKRKYGRL